MAPDNDHLINYGAAGPSQAFGLWHRESMVAVYGSFNDLQLNESLITGTWEQWVVTLEDGQAKVYRDGQEVGSGPLTLSTELNRLRIGSAPHDTPIRDHDFKGELDDIRIYNRALSAEEIRELYELEKPEIDLDPASASADPLGETLTFEVTAPAGTLWIAESLANWISITGNATGTGPGTGQ